MSNNQTSLLAGAAFALLWLAAPIHAASDPVAFTRPDGKALSAASIDRRVTELTTAARVPGLALALIQGGQIRFARGYGERDTRASLPLTTDTVMAAASLTKAAFAWMCLSLVSDGILDLDRPIAGYLPKPLPAYPNYADLAADPRWRKFTARMLLSHTSGLPNFRWVNDDRKLDIKFEPGSRYVYSGEGILLLQFVLEQGLGLSVKGEMQHRVFDRFGMKRTAMTWRDQFADNYAIGYDRDGRPLGHRRRSEVDAAGSMDTTLDDYARFLSGVVRGEGLDPRSYAELFGRQIAITSLHQFPSHRPVDTTANRAIDLSYGLGWGLFTTPYGRAFFKEGHDDGTNNYALCIEKGQTCVLILTNSENGEGIFLYLVDALLGHTNLPWVWEGYVPYDRHSPS